MWEILHILVTSTNYEWAYSQRECVKYFILYLKRQSINYIVSFKSEKYVFNNTAVKDTNYELNSNCNKMWVKNMYSLIIIALN